MGTNALKECSVCKQKKSLDNFYNMKASKDGKYPRCKVCDSKAHLDYRRRNAEKYKHSVHKRRIKYMYNIEYSEYERMCKEQNYVCKICKGPNDNNWMLAVDHCHETGKVRGLLCNTCNRALGFFEHNPSMLENAIRYLQSVTH